MALDFKLTPGKVKTRPSRSEYDEQCALISWARWSARLCQHTDPLKGDALRWLHAIPNGLFLSHDRRVRTALGRKAVAAGLTAGVADLFLPYATEHAGGLYIEMKVGKNKLADDQLEFHLDARRLGYEAVTCYSWPQAAREIVGYLDLTNHAPIPKE
jgi:hypothetical protein